MRAVRGGDLKTLTRGGDLKTVTRGGQYRHSRYNSNNINNSHFIGGRNTMGGVVSAVPKLLGFGEEEMRNMSEKDLRDAIMKQMADPAKAQMIMQRGGLGPLAAMAMGLLPMLLGKGGSGSLLDVQMKSTPELQEQRGGLSIPPALMAKGLPLLKTVGMPILMGSLASLGDNLTDKIFGEGVRSNKKAHHKRPRQRRQSKMARSKPGKKMTKRHKSTGQLRKVRRGKKRTVSKRKRQRSQKSSYKSSKQLLSNALQSVKKNVGTRSVLDGLANMGKKTVQRQIRKSKKHLVPPSFSPSLAATPFGEKIQDNINRSIAQRQAPSSSFIPSGINV